MIKQTFGKSTLIFAAVLFGVYSESQKQETLRESNSEILRHLSDIKSENENLTQTVQDKLEPVSKLVSTVDQLKVQQDRLEENLQLLLDVSKLNFGQLLSNAVKQSNIDQIRLLIKAGAPVEYEDSTKNRPIHIATENSKHGIIEFLIENHADVNVHGQYGYTPLHWTSYNGCLNCARILLENGAIVDSRDKWLDTPLIKSSKYGYTELVQLLLSKGAEVDARQEEGYTALHMASREGRVGVVKLLLEHGADPHLKNKYGHTASDLASRNEHGEVILLLKNKMDGESEKQTEGKGQL